MTFMDAQTFATESQVPPPPISLEEYRVRREQVLEALDGAAAVVFAGTDPGDDSLVVRWKTNRLFWYLTGLDYESGAAILFDPSAEDRDRRITLFLAPRDPEAERWDGPRDFLDSSLKAKTGFSSLARITSLPARLTDAARKTKRLACLHPFTPYNGPVSPDLEIFRKVCDHVPGVGIEDQTQLLPRMRATKSPAELALIAHAVSVTRHALDAVLAYVHPGVTEKDLADVLLETFRKHGAEPAFLPIVAAGPNSTVLHHRRLDRVLESTDLVVIDCGAAVHGYAADVTRTVPVQGHFSGEQQHIYDIVLEANQAAIEAVRPGATLREIQGQALEVIKAAGYEDFFFHGIGHQLGIDVHDVTPDGPLVPGMVLTIEPGIYLEDRGIGIRIEDDVLVTDQGRQVLTAEIPKTPGDIEAAITRAKSASA
ncbi:MAG: Xaa-Pro peptidase family protein [Thermoleophilia bacterium]|nr:Xaa-Pro peptidase family protein [Thermoleophilia bacterium]